MKVRMAVAALALVCAGSGVGIAQSAPAATPATPDVCAGDWSIAAAAKANYEAYMVNRPDANGSVVFTQWEDLSSARRFAWRQATVRAAHVMCWGS